MPPVILIIALRVTRETDTASSAATQPACGLLVLASPDPQRYHEGMGTALLERMGDLAVSVAERAISLNKLNAPLGQPQAEMPRMAAIVEDMLHRTLDAFVKGDVELARAIFRTDDEVDALRDTVYKALIATMRNQPELVDAAVHLMFVARSLERIADHATNIAETVYFMIEGRLITDQRPKGDFTNFGATQLRKG